MKIPNTVEHSLIQRYFKYNHLLDGEHIPRRKRGSSIAHYDLQNSSIISGMLGYKNPKRIYFEYKNPLYFKYEITKVVDDNCLLCGKPLEISQDVVEYVSCRSCNRIDAILPIGYYDSLYGTEVSRTPRSEHAVFTNEYFELTADFKFDEVLYRNISREYIRRVLSSKSVYKLKFIGNITHKPLIIINNHITLYLSDFDEIEFPEDVKNSTLCVLGWKKLYYK